MKHKLCLTLACLLAFILLLTCPAMAASPFPDVDENADYAEAVEYLKDVGIMKGDDQGNFNPNKTVTRAEMATIICNMLGETEDLTVSDEFSDVPTTFWANKYITRAKELGVISGYGNKKFGPNDQVTYEQVLTMIINVKGRTDEANKAGGYPLGFISVAEERGYTEGLLIEVGHNLTRWQVALILYNSLV